ncbi:MAG TPA: OsmC family protein [Candidatus Lokiarchaeia archaeon]|nr:OsmC family protein [Candidatus Lokiarchaeia archaeon]
MPKRTSKAIWNGSLTDGSGRMELGSGAFQGQYSAGSRFGSEEGTNPEELIAAAHAGCFSMAFSLILGKEGFTPDAIETSSTVTIERQGEGYTITMIELDVEGSVPDIEEEKFIELAEMAKNGCPVSKALETVPITMNARLKS